MTTGYYLQDNPNPNFAQFGWPRSKVSGVIGVHTTESGVDMEGADPGVENTAAFIRRRTDPGSYHAMGDADSRIKLVHPRYAAWADTTNNAHAMSVSGAMNAARWRDLPPARADAIVRNMALAAAELVRDALQAGLLGVAPPARRISAQEAVSGSKAGFYGHGETNPGRRYDPGQHFNWDLFLTTYAAAVSGEPEEDDMPSAQDVAKEVVEQLLNHNVPREGEGQKGTTNLRAVVANFDSSNEAVIRETVKRIFNTPVKREGGGTQLGETTTLGAVVGWFDSAVLGLAGAVSETAKESGASAEDVIEAVRKALAEGTVRVDVNVQGVDK